MSVPALALSRAQLACFSRSSTAGKHVRGVGGADAHERGEVVVHLGEPGDRLAVAERLDGEVVEPVEVPADELDVGSHVEIARQADKRHVLEQPLQQHGDPRRDRAAGVPCGQLGQALSGSLEVLRRDHDGSGTRRQRACTSPIRRGPCRGDLAVPAVPQGGDTGERLRLGDARRSDRTVGAAIAVVGVVDAEVVVSSSALAALAAGAAEAPGAASTGDCWMNVYQSRIVPPLPPGPPGPPSVPAVGLATSFGSRITRVARVGDDHDELGVVAVRAAFSDGTRRGRGT